MAVNYAWCDTVLEHPEAPHANKAWLYIGHIGKDRPQGGATSGSGRDVIVAYPFPLAAATPVNPIEKMAL